MHTYMGVEIYFRAEAAKYLGISWAQLGTYLIQYRIFPHPDGKIPHTIGSKERRGVFWYKDTLDLFAEQYMHKVNVNRNIKSYVNKGYTALPRHSFTPPTSVADTLAEAMEWDES